jgi:short-subunit dehydrogenase
MKPTDARVLLTGATGGIGEATTQALLAAGAAVMLVGRSPARLSALARPLAEKGGAGRVAWHAADLTQLDSLSDLASAASAWGCNTVVHNAGLPGFGRLEAMAPADMQALLHTNLLAPMLLTQALLPSLRTRRQAQIICMGSALGRIGLPGYSAYSASKFGLRGFAEALRRELADSPVRVQYLGPRSTRTGFNNSAVETYNRATGTAMDSPTQVARALVRMLESGRAESFMGFPETLAVRINGIVPAWLDKAFARHRRSLPA